ncbi:hypothetical protein BpHYR1_014844, partial [Brachionus plicatilis]
INYYYILYFDFLILISNFNLPITISSLTCFQNIKITTQNFFNMTIMFCEIQYKMIKRTEKNLKTILHSQN